jgi:hypothetical protein
VWLAELLSCGTPFPLDRLSALVKREYVLSRLTENVEPAMQVQPVLDTRGKAAGVYRYDGNVANRALELLGREIGMFRDRGDDKPFWDGDPKTNE